MLVVMTEGLWTMNRRLDTTMAEANPPLSQTEDIASLFQQHKENEIRELSRREGVSDGMECLQGRAVDGLSQALDIPLASHASEALYPSWD